MSRTTHVAKVRGLAGTSGARPVWLWLLGVAAGMAVSEPAGAQIRFENVSQAAGIAALPRSTHPDPKIASSRRDFENVYAPGYFREIRDLTFADVDGDGNLDVFALDGVYSLWSRLWLGDGRGGFKEVPSTSMDFMLAGIEESLSDSFWRALAYDYRGRGAQSLLVTGAGSRRLSIMAPRASSADSTASTGSTDSASSRQAGSPQASSGQAGTAGDVRIVSEGLESAGRSVLLADFDGDGCVDMAMGARPDRSGNGVEGNGRLLCGIRLFGEIEWGRTWSTLPTGSGDVAADFDNDGRTDILCRGQQTARLLRNEGNRRFRDATQGSGLESLPPGGPIAVADFDNDGRLDLVAVGVSPGAKEGGYKAYRNKGGGHFAEVTAEAGFGQVGNAAKPRFGTAVAADFDNDGWVDLLLCEGDRQRLFRNTGNMRFQEETEKSGISGPVTAESSNAAGDVDNDGRVDLLCVTADRGAGLLHNVTRNENGWIKVKLSGPPGNPEGAGARITVFAPGKLGDEKAILGHQEWIVASDFKVARPLHFGLGTHKTCDIRVVFPGGKTAEQRGAQAGALTTLSQPAER